ncbi:hypothetical protein C8T65DRAFT_696392 [Cerioporus squamosus]|nr:hypothetical protein C8T65DRAFT_696392 [Cerioporus squamosus]
MATDGSPPAQYAEWLIGLRQLNTFDHLRRDFQDGITTESAPAPVSEPPSPLLWTPAHATWLIGIALYVPRGSVLLFVSPGISNHGPLASGECEDKVEMGDCLPARSITMYRPTQPDNRDNSESIWRRRRPILTLPPEEEDPATLNEVLHESEQPLTPRTRMQLGLPPLSPGVEQWRAGSSEWGIDPPTEQELDNSARWDDEPEVWGAPLRGNWGEVEEWELGVISLVRTESGGHARDVQVAVLLTGHSVAHVEWNYRDEVLLPLPRSILDADAWPAVPDGLQLTSWALSEDAQRSFHEFTQIFDIILAKTDTANGARTGNAAHRVLEHARAILPREVWDCEVREDPYAWGRANRG